jgi:hypothetical protein
MSPRELTHRLAEQWRRNVSRHDRRGWSRFSHADGPLSPLAALQGLPDIAWPPGLEEAAFPGEEPFSFLGTTPPVAPPGKWPEDYWHRDPVTGSRWPGAETFCFDVAWRDVADRSDVKFVLELNRLQHLQASCVRAMCDRDAAGADAAAMTLLHWMEQNPPFRGINWLSGIELALRLVSAAFVVSALEFTDPEHGHRSALRSFIAAHAYWLDRFPSLHSSANNHLVAEGLGLLIASELMPDLPAQYGKHGREILREAARTQFHDDGTGVEQSPTYSAFTLEMLLLAIVIDRSKGEDPSQEAVDLLARAAAHLKALLDTGGQPPRIGDDDEGRVIVTAPQREDLYVASIVAGAAGVLDRPDLSPGVTPLELRDLLFHPPNQPGAAQSGVIDFPSGGYTAVREEVRGRRMLLVMDHGPVGFDPLAAHGHADALAVWLHLDDQPVFVDAGTYRYNATDGWRDWLRSSLAHNTLSIDGESQSLTAGAFNWRHKARAQRIHVWTGAEWEIAARHDGYLARCGVVHQRICRQAKNGFLVEDALITASGANAMDAFRHDVVIGFLIDPDLSVIANVDGVVLSRQGTPMVRVASRSNIPAQIIRGQEDGAAVIHSPAYNHARPATRIEFRPSRFDTPHQVHVEIIDPQLRAGT